METITLLIGMMILVHITSQSGVFEFVAIKGKSSWRKTDSHFIITIPINCCRISILDNVTTVLLIVPVTLSITRILKVNPVPYLISECCFQI